jgi:hypothetical protein
MAELVEQVGALNAAMEQGRQQAALTDAELASIQQQLAERTEQLLGATAARAAKEAELHSMQQQLAELVDTKIAALEKELADKVLQLLSMEERLQQSSTESAAAAEAQGQQRPVAPLGALELKVISSDDVWNELAFLDHRKRTPHTPHPLLFCSDKDRKEFTCQLCYMLLVQPIAFNNGDGSLDGELLPCGDGPYCRACVVRHLLISPACPACQQPTTPEQLIDDTRTERALRSAQVRCAFYVEGCSWTGEVRDFEAHQAACASAGGGTGT